MNIKTVPASLKYFTWKVQQNRLISTKKKTKKNKKYNLEKRIRSIKFLIQIDETKNLKERLLALI
jgi:hypothetical protein